MKHAYLIIAHNNFYVLDKLLELIDDIRNDIYLHIDAKCKNFDFDKYKEKIKYSNIYFVKQFNVLWGEYSLIEAEMTLFNDAYCHGGYSYYHLLSGTDLPIKSQNYIHNFFQNNNGIEFITCTTNDYAIKNNIVSRFNSYWHTNNLFLKFLNKIRYKRYRNNFIVSYGSEWVSVTGDFVKCILEHKKWINKQFKYSHACDEVYKQCLAMNTEFKNKLFEKPRNQDTISFNMRLIDWSLGGAHPKTFSINDLNELMNSEGLFARKFDENIDKEIVDEIYNKIKL